MVTSKRIDYMIQCLQVALDEYDYAAKYRMECPEYEIETNEWALFVETNRTPNYTLIRENLRNVARMANITAG